MANVYIEARPKGRPEGSHIDDYVVEDHAVSVLVRQSSNRLTNLKGSSELAPIRRVRRSGEVVGA
jgi:hypothetical protein